MAEDPRMLPYEPYHRTGALIQIDEPVITETECTPYGEPEEMTDVQRVAFERDQVKHEVETLGRFHELSDAFKADRSDIFAGVEAKAVAKIQQIMNNLTETQIWKMQAKDKIKAARDLASIVTSFHEHERLERGESTENVSIIVAEIKKMKKEMGQ